MQRYGQRQNVESVFSAVKRRLGGRLASRKLASQMNELYLKAICHNLWKLTHAIFDVGLEPVFWPDGEQDVA